MIDAVILAGGEGRRMGGQDKGLVDLAGKPLVSWMIAALEAQTHAVDHIMISANRNQPAYAQMGFAVLGDSGTPAGPLAGIYTALQNTQADYLLVVPCDMPLLPADTLARLWQAMQSHQAQLTYAHSGNEPAHSVVCLMRRSVCEGLAKRLANQELRLGAWYTALQAVPVDFPAGCLGNFNTAAELAALAAQLSEPSMAMDVTGELTHFNAQGEAHMVNVGAKNETQRIALAEGEISMQPATMSKIDAGASKGDVLGVARVAAIMASKKTADLIPLCHPLPLTRIEVEFIVDRARNTVRCRVTSETVGRTGVEMEALTAVSVGLLTIYDMLKAIDRSMTISGIRLLEKQGGKSGHWRAEDTIRL